MLGVPRNEVILTDYTIEWKKDFEKEKQKILDICSNIILNIEHVGSTSVPGLIAKPLIDIALVFDKEQKDNIINNLEHLDYEFVEEAGDVDRLFFAKRKNGNSYYHIHAYYKGSENYRKQVLFRDCLRNNSIIRDQYAQLKQTLYEQYKDNRSNYTLGKAAFIQNVLDKNIH